jgi:predicted Zn-dependent protease
MSLNLSSPRPGRVVGPSDSPSERYLTPAACAALFRRIVQLAPQGDTRVTITSVWRGTTRWVRNGLIASSDRVDHTVALTRYLQGTSGKAVTNQLDEESLRLAITTAERQANREQINLDTDFVSGPRPSPTSDLFKPSTYNLLAAGRAAAAGALVAPTAARGLLAGGYLEARADTLGVYDTQGLASYAVTTNAQYTVTVRDATGTASGWAGLDHADWTRIDPAALSARALEKCLASANPVAIEPGRYTVILEPQAVHELMQVALSQAVLLRFDNERSDLYPYNLRRAPRKGAGTAKFGLQLLDPRITLSTDPLDPDGGYVPFDEHGVPYSAVTWFEQGVLRQLPYDLDFALDRLNSGVAHPYTAAYRMRGGETSVEEMITSTERGILVTRFVGVRLLHYRSELATGTTADGTWLIERGQRAKPVKNLRFNMSPLEAFNQVEALGVPQRVFSPDAPAIVPPIKLRDFLFTSSTDAV